ncbi:precorrin-2 C(20)-methyltransferase [Ochrobactrum soli]|uniref:Precorrin-2 C(20)-methyltransferase n=2 Tax=Ochrobactrum TaxID=528 RepID=A0ABD5JQ15_9HYPH|nr:MULTISPECIES: precorrin-2 C(20)-methyltransferase [Brucella]MCI1001318.1 precorrin-2 C(20)-methyltransferase [Ochrobactrum sp. C6C9]RRD23206.1 precorrin-2 C(20)-methyltransferase [Brucellaceae bacterium VT-16-1752]WHT42302.1 precorrin-2 C(20)-methyltransferase [Ochrobactrum sp. SSR]MDX4072483.1 precorrin-2 C(20)-methyltransferase [Brucella sp. NBRC 113783]RLL75699.1 precorrin-2 C(20)-methyltransferase [[Ochrobactrum] soli]
MTTKGKLFGLGVGPGDPELITLKALRLLKSAPVVAYHAAKGKKGNALTIVEDYLSPEQVLVPLIYPVTTEKLPAHMDYEQIVSDFYGEITTTIAGYLDQGQDVAVIAEGDPFFYGSFMYIHDRLAESYETTVVPGVCSVLGASAVLGAPLVYRNQTLSILSGVMEAGELKRRLADTGAAAIMKLGKNLDKVRDVLTDLSLMDRALYVERATMANQRIVPLSDVSGSDCPYFSIILVPGQKWNGA